MKPAAHCELNIKKLTHQFGGFTALQDINFCLKKASLTAIIGPNGGGKSTLVKCITGCYKPTQGQVEFIGSQARDFSYVPQKAELDISFPITVREVAGTGLVDKNNIYKKISRADQEKLSHVLESMGLYPQQNQLVETLSGGQFQRLLFARLLLQDQPLIILDEPFSHIDEKTKEVLLNMIETWHRQGKTILVILHELDLVKKYFPESILLAREVIAKGPTADVLTDHNMAQAFTKILEVTSC